MQIDEIWYASQERANNTFCLRSYDDKGKLIIKDNRFVFHGEAGDININNPRNIYLKSQKFKWSLWFLLLGFALPIYIIIYMGITTLPIIIKSIFIVVCVLSLAVGMMFIFIMKWVVIEGINDKNEETKYYFYDGANNGWSGIFGGTKKLYNSIKELMGGV